MTLYERSTSRSRFAPSIALASPYTVTYGPIATTPGIASPGMPRTGTIGTFPVLIVPWEHTQRLQRTDLLGGLTVNEASMLSVPLITASRPT